MYKNDPAKTTGSLIEDALLFINHDLIIKDTNGACIRLFGDQVIGSSLEDQILYSGLAEEVLAHLLFERVGDHAKNIAEATIYMCSGEMNRFDSLEDNQDV